MAAGDRPVMKNPPMTPMMADGGNMAVDTVDPGTGFAAFPDQVCSQLTVVNDTGVGIEVRQDGEGVAIPIINDGMFSFFGITNANQLSVRRKDLSNVVVKVKARWEA